MEDKILDSFEEKILPKFADKSFKQFFVGILIYGLIIFFNINFNHEFETKKFPALITLIVGLIAFILTILGLINGIKSIIKKEDSLWKKYGATLGNFILVLILSLILFANFIDFYIAF